MDGRMETLGRIAAEVEGLRRLQEKFSRLRDGQVIELEPVDPNVPIKVRPAKRRGHHGIVTSGAKVNYTKETA